MEELGIINSRKLVYQRHALDVNWTKAFPMENWLLLVVIEGKNKSILAEISSKAIVHNVCYVCCAGEQSELLHDMVDEEIVFRQVDIEDLYLPDHFIITTWENNIQDAFWSAFFSSNNDEEEILTVVCLDASMAGIKVELENFLLSN
ncbi:MAG: hypothetical protein V4560_04365 [Bacteroidota bacterium]